MIDCPICYGEGMILGVLACNAVVCCRNCGMNFFVSADEAVDLEADAANEFEAEFS